MGHIHESQPNGGFCRGCRGCQGIHEGQGEGKARSFQPGSAVKKEAIVDWIHGMFGLRVIRKTILSFDPAESKQVTRDYLGNDGAGSVPFFGDVLQNTVDYDLIVATQRPAESVSHEAFGQVAGQFAFSLGEQSFELGGRGESSTVRQLACGVDREPLFVLVPPPSDGIEVFQAEADRVEYFVTVAAGRLRLMQFSPLTQSQTLDFLVLLLFQFGDVGRWGRNAFAKNLLQYPYSSAHRTRAIGERGGGQGRGHAEDAPRLGLSNFTLRIFGPEMGSLVS